jgi:hypothetical protein
MPKLKHLAHLHQTAQLTGLKHYNQSVIEIQVTTHNKPTSNKAFFFSAT